MILWDTIIIHHTYRQGIDDNEKYLDWTGIINYHRSWRINGISISEIEAKKLLFEGKYVEPPWQDVGYHYGIEYVDNRLVICPGRSMHMQGAHCLKMNRRALGIANIGNFDINSPDKNLYQLTAQLCHFLILKYPLIQIERIFPHSEFSDKTCPGKKYDMDKLRNLVKKCNDYRYE